MKDFEDDDFGELYTDVELQASSAISSLLVQHHLPQNEELDSDTDDELNIVLNDEDSDSAGRNGGGSDDVKIEGAAEMPKRSCVSAYMNHMKGRTLTGLMSEDGDYCGKDVGYSAATAPFHVPADSMLPQVGRNFSLPRYRSIFDVNIDSFRGKPWDFGADITDFFNFGLDEEQLRQHKSSRSTMFPVSESSQVNKVYPGVEHGNPVQEVMTNGALHCSDIKDKKLGQLIVKGRAIEVEESVAERQPSMVLRHVPSYDDSDVIQIPLQDCLGEPSDAGKEEFGCLLHGIPGTDQNGKIDANDKEMAMDGPEEFAGISALPIPERSSVAENVSKLVDPANNKLQISSSNDDGADHISHNSDRIAEPRGRVKQIDEGLYGVSQIEQEKLSLASSLFEIDTEPSDYSTSVDLEKDRATPKRSHLKSGDESEDSFAKDYDDSTISGAEMKLNKRRDSSNRSMIKRETHPNWRLKDSISQKNYALDDYVVSSVSQSRGLSDWENSQGNCKERNASRPDFNHYDRECSSPSYYSSKRVCVDEWLGGNHVQDVHRGSSYRKGHSILIDDMDPYFRRNWKKREMGNSENYREDKGERDYCSFKESKSAKEMISSRPYSSTRHFESNFISYNSKDASPSGIDTEYNQFNEKYNQAGRFRHHRYEDYFLQDRHGTYFSSKYGEQRSLWKSYSREFPSHRKVTSGKSERHRRSPPIIDRSWAIEPEDRPGTYLTSRDSKRGYFGKSYSRLPGHREIVNSGRNERHKKGPLVVDEYLVTEPEDEYEDFMDYELPHHPFREPHETERTLEVLGSSREELYDTRPIRRYGQSLRSKVDNRSGFGLSSAYSEVYELGDAIAYRHGGIRLERTRYSKQSKVLHLCESGLTSRHGDDKFRTKEASVFHRRNSKYAVHAKYEKLNDGKFEDDMQAEQHKYMTLREESAILHVNKGFHVVDRIQDDQKKPFSSGSVDLYVMDGKTSRKSHKRRNTMHTAYPEDNKTKGAYTTRTGGQEGIDKFPVTEPNNELDIEEGQFVAEVPIPQKPSKKKNMSEPTQATERNEVDGEIDEKRLLETLAKMEKRRERFKEAATQVKGPQLQVKINRSSDDTSLSKNRVMDIVVEEAAVTTFQRPSRKRRWCGN